MLNGQRIDIEQHIIHKFVEYDESTKFIEGRVAVQFSIDNYDRSISREDAFSINEFYESLHFDGVFGDDIGKLTAIAYFK